MMGNKLSIFYLKGLRRVRLSNGVTYTATVGEAVQLNSGESYKAVVRGARVDITIYDGSIPL